MLLSQNIQCLRSSKRKQEVTERPTCRLLLPNRSDKGNKITEAMLANDKLLTPKKMKIGKNLGLELFRDLDWIE